MHPDPNGARWHVAGVHGDSEAKSLTLDLSELNLEPGTKFTLITEGGDGSMGLAQKTVTLEKGKTVPLEIPPTGGFVLTAE